MNTRKIFTLPVLIFVVLTMLACTIFIGGPDYPETRIPVSTEAAGEIQSAMQTAIAEGESTGQMTLVITETQLTSYLTYKLQKKTDPFIADPQVTLRDGQIQVYGTAEQGYFKATASIVLSAGIDENGDIKIELVSADFGPLPVPQALLNTIAATMQETFTGAIGPAAIGFRLETITIADGTMTVTGRTK